ncbi:FixH family protein [uncultured Propionivibrio sp.]|uniref:FixH family protein n=1 Tax=uncultured Propionivibrio sp. TaxID=426737 RepID=UPI0029C04EE6|nr:FixH family protein [uncultured Propionivibrio sp.]
MNENPSSRPLPWYRHRWPWLLMAGPAIVVVAGFITLVLALRSNDGLVSDDYYKQGLGINQTTARDQAAARLGLQAQVMLGGHELRVMLRANDAATALPETLSLRLMHPTRSGEDQVLSLRRQAGDLYSGRLERPLSGRWRVSIEDDGRMWRLTGDWLVDKAPVLALPK